MSPSTDEKRRAGQWKGGRNVEEEGGGSRGDEFANQHENRFCFPVALSPSYLTSLTIVSAQQDPSSPSSHKSAPCQPLPLSCPVLSTSTHPP
eukprot:764614-Hanusia_phi.AAC.5